MAATEAATAVEAFAAVKFSTVVAVFMESAVTSEFAPVPSAPVVISPFTSAAPFIPVATAEAEVISITEPVISVVPTAAVKRATVETVKPRPGADENASGKVLRAIVTIWGARIRVVTVVAVGADRRRPDVYRSSSHNHRPDSHANPYPHLRVGSTDSRDKHERSCH